MFNQKNQKEQIIKQIINISKNIKCIYDNMNIQNRDSLEKELRLEVTKENILLDALNIKNSNSKEIYLDFINCLEESLFEDFNFELKDPSLQTMFNEYLKITNTERQYTNDLVLKRFESYLIKKFKSNPTKSKEITDNSKRRKENRATVNHAAAIDYETSIVKFLDELIDENYEKIIDENSFKNLRSIYKGVANKAIDEENRILFTDKLIEEKYLNKDLSIDMKNKCLENNFDPEYVEEVYNQFVAEAVNDHSRSCYLQNNKIITDYHRIMNAEDISIYRNNDLSDKDKAEIVRTTVNFQLLKASLYLLDNEELEINRDKYQKVTENSAKKSTQSIIDSMNEVIYRKKKEKSLVMTKKLSS